MMDLKMQSNSSNESTRIDYSPTRSEICICREQFRPKKINIEKALLTCCVHVGLENNATVRAFVSPQDLPFSRDLYSGFESFCMTLMPSYISSFWETFVQDTRPAILVGLSGTYRVRNLSVCQEKSLFRWLLPRIGHVKASLLRGADALFFGLEGSLLVEEKIGKFKTMDFGIRSKKFLARIIQERSDEEFLKGLMSPYTSASKCWGFGAFYYPGSDAMPVVVHCLPGLKSPLDLGAVNRILFQFKSWFNGHVNVDIEELWLVSDNPMLDIFLATIAVSELPFSLKQIVLPDLVFGMSSLGSSLLFLTQSRANRILLYIGYDQVRFVSIPRR